MADRFYGYQYDTTPRKLNSDYAPYRKRYPQEEEPVTTSRKRSKNIKKDAFGTDRAKANASKRGKAVQKNEVPEYAKKQVDVRKIKKQVNVQKIEYNNFEKDVQNEDKGVEVEKVSKVNVKAKLRIITYLVVGFSVLFAISYQNSLISESFNKKEQYRKEMEALRKTNQQIEVSIENNLNLNYIEQAAKDRLGMQKLNNDQKIYVSLPKVDYVAPASEQIVMEDNLNFFERLFGGLWK
ncbi:MAG: hypothetical protein IKD76_08595 [Clostridia bacterium]|nr:hypothetical protein [Clostridia bacterium]